MSSRPRDDASAGDASLDALLAEVYRQAAASGGAPTLRAWLERAEAWRILDALREARGNRSAAARALGIGRRTLYAKMKRFGIQPAWAAGRGWNGRLRAARA